VRLARERLATQRFTNTDADAGRNVAEKLLFREATRTPWKERRSMMGE
jgi:hypothetical protein